MRSKSKQRELKYSNVREMVEKRESGFTAPYLKLPEGAQLFKPKAGVMLLDIIPFVAGAGNPGAEEGMVHWERTIYVHRGVGADSQSYLCPRRTSKSRCPICEFQQKLRSEDDDEQQDLIKSLAPKERQLFNVIDRKNPDKGLQLWDFSYHLFGRLLLASIRDSDEDEGWELFFRLDKGFTLKVGFGEKAYAGRAYFEAETIHFKPRVEPLDEDLLEQATCLDEILVEKDYDELKELFLETAKDEGKGKKKPKEEEEDENLEEDEDEDEEETSKHKARKPKDDDEDLDDFDKDVEDADEEEGDEDDEKPKKKKPKEVEEDLEADEDEEEEAPKKKKKAKVEDDDFEDLDEEDEEEESEDEEEEDDASKKRNRFAKSKGDKGWDTDDDEDEAPKKKGKK